MSKKDVVFIFSSIFNAFRKLLLKENLYKLPKLNLSKGSSKISNGFSKSVKQQHCA